MREPSDSTGDDEWGFITARAKPSPQTATNKEALADLIESESSTPAEPQKNVVGSRLESWGDQSSIEQLRGRARPLSWAIAAVFVIGYINEIVAGSRFVSLLGLKAVIIIYPLAGLGLIAVALLQITWIDRLPRDKALSRVTKIYAGGFVIGLILVAIPQTTIIGSGVIWLFADQLNFLLPLIIWTMTSDVFNAGEGRKIYPSITQWQYGGQLTGLAISALAPFLFIPLGIPLPYLLLICPIGLLLIGVLLPRALKDSALSQGHGRDENVVESLKSAWSFVGGVKAFTAMFSTSVAVFTAGMIYKGAFLSNSEVIVNDPAKLQVIYGLTMIAVFIMCGVLQKFFVTKILERFTIPGSLLLLPIFATACGIFMAWGLIGGLGIKPQYLPFLIIGIILWWVPRWSIDDVARRTALAVVPNERRARVSFIIDLLPICVGLIAAGLVLGLTYATGLTELAPLIALPFALFAIFPARVMAKEWDKALLSPLLRIRKRLN
jgi:hypothetical protein